MSLDLALSIKKAYPHIKIVGEVKTRSPFGYVNLNRMDREDMVRALNDCPAIDIISIHTNEAWQGSFEWLREACVIVRKPVLAKGFHDTIHDVKLAFDCGAAHVLTVGWWSGDDRCWVEVEDLDDLGPCGFGASKVVWNARNPRTGNPRWVISVGETPRQTTDWARQRRAGWLCQASGIKTVADVHPKVNAVLIGEALWTP